MTTAPLDELRALLKKTPNQANWKKVCELLDRCAEASLPDALAAIDAQAARWDVDTRKRGAWELPARYSPQAWTKRLLAGDVPPAFSAARFFQLHAAKVTDAGLARILDTRALGAITHLYLGSCSLGGGALALLGAHEPELGALRHLVLTDNALAPDGLGALLATPLAQRLVTLDVSRTPLDERAIEAVLTTPLPALRTLDLSFIAVSAERMAAIVEADTLPKVDALQVATRDAQTPVATLRARGKGHAHLLAALRDPG
jgi:hypothetical protein